MKWKLPNLINSNDILFISLFCFARVHLQNTIVFVCCGSLWPLQHRICEAASFMFYLLFKLLVRISDMFPLLFTAERSRIDKYFSPSLWHGNYDYFLEYVSMYILQPHKLILWANYIQLPILVQCACVPDVQAIVHMVRGEKNTMNNHQYLLGIFFFEFLTLRFACRINNLLIFVIFVFVFQERVEMRLPHSIWRASVGCKMRI